MNELDAILEGITKSTSIVRQRYATDLKVSLNALKALHKTATQEENYSAPLFDIDAAIIKARQTVSHGFNGISAAVAKSDARARWLQKGFLWPCLTPVSLLEQLRSTSKYTLASGMERSLFEYAISITRLQRLLRIDDARRRTQLQRLRDEQKNTGHENWDPHEYRDWLLLEIDANILIRKDQVEVALATISPASNSNSVLQMNMGQGKFSYMIH